VAAAERSPLLELLQRRLGLSLTDIRPTGGNGQRRTFYARLVGAVVVVKWGLDPGVPTSRSCTQQFARLRHDAERRSQAIS
jgi:hypothetical protein